MSQTKWYNKSDTDLRLFYALSDGVLSFAHCVADLLKTLLLIGLDNFDSQLGTHKTLAIKGKSESITEQ